MTRELPQPSGGRRWAAVVAAGFLLVPVGTAGVDPTEFATPQPPPLPQPVPAQPARPLPPPRKTSDSLDFPPLPPGIGQPPSLESPRPRPLGAQATMVPPELAGISYPEAQYPARGGHYGKGSHTTPATVVPPLGSSVRAAMDAQRLNALCEYFVLYREDFLMGTPELNASGARHLDGIVRRLGMTGAAIKIEPTGTPGLDELRRAAVLNLLVRSGVPAEVASTRTVIGGTRAEGLLYTDIEAVYGRFINQRGGQGGTGGGGIGGIGGGSIGSGSGIVR